MAPVINGTGGAASQPLEKPGCGRGAGLATRRGPRGQRVTLAGSGVGGRAGQESLAELPRAG